MHCASETRLVYFLRVAAYSITAYYSCRAVQLDQYLLDYCYEDLIGLQRPGIGGFAANTRKPQ